MARAAAETLAEASLPDRHLPEGTVQTKSSKAPVAPVLTCRRLPDPPL